MFSQNFDHKTFYLWVRIGSGEGMGSLPQNIYFSSRVTVPTNQSPAVPQLMMLFIYVGLTCM